MFSNIAYEAYFIFIGLKIHEELLKIITSEAFFRALALLIFGVVLLTAMIRYFSQFSAIGLLARKGFPLSGFFKIVFVFALGISILQVSSGIEVHNSDRESWHTNRYVMSKLSSVSGTHEVSFVFDLMMRSAQEIGAFSTFIVERLFPAPNSQSKEPFFFYRAAMFAGAVQIEDKGLRDHISIYTEECVEKAIAAYSRADKSLGTQYLNAFYGRNGPLEAVNEELAKIDIGKYGGTNQNCLDLKDQMHARLIDYVANKTGHLQGAVESSSMTMRSGDPVSIILNKAASSALTSHLINDKDSFLGMEQASQLPTGSVGGFFQLMSRLRTFPGITSLFDIRPGNPVHGASEAAERAKQFNELLVRAPVIRGVALMFLTAVFPVLFFFIVAMKWQVLVLWFTQVLGICMWPAIWALIYSVMTNAALSVDTLRDFGELSDGVSLTAANLINQKLYFFFSVMQWLMIASAAAINGGLFWAQRTILTSTNEEHAPQPIGEIAETSKNVAVAGAARSAIGGVL